MKMVRYMWVMLVVGMIFGGVALAQETMPPTLCTQEDYLALQTGISNLIGGLSDNAMYDPTYIMMQVRRALETYQLICNQKFTSETHPSGIIGPILFDGTLYEVTYTGIPTGNIDVGGSVTMEELSGDCGFLNMMLISSDNMTETTLMRFGENCEAMIEVHRSGAWELTFVKIQ